VAARAHDRVSSAARSSRRFLRRASRTIACSRACSGVQVERLRIWGIFAVLFFFILDIRDVAVMTAVLLVVLAAV